MRDGYSGDVHRQRQRGTRVLEIKISLFMMEIFKDVHIQLVAVVQHADNNATEPFSLPLSLSTRLCTNDVFM